MIELPGSRRTRVIAGVFIVGMVLAGIVGAAVLAQNSETLFGSGPVLIVIDFDEVQAMVDETYLTGLGPRPGGSEAEDLAAKYVVDQFMAAGLDDAYIEEYDVEVFEVNTAEVSLVAYGPLMRLPMIGSTPVSFDHITDFVVQGFSGSRTAATGPLAHTTDLFIEPVGNGTEGTMWGSAGGKAALVSYEEDSPSASELLFMARDAGAEAVIMNNHHIHEEIGYMPIFKGTYVLEGESQRPNIPIFMTTKTVGDQIANAASSSKIRINFDVVIETRSVPVSVGVLKGLQVPDDFVVIGAHMDTVYNGPGACDNTVGVVSVLGQARALASYTPKKSIMFMTYGAEEIGLLGSSAYVEVHRQDVVDHCIHMFNSDMPNCKLDRDDRLWIGTTCNKTLNTYRDVNDRLLKDHSTKYSKFAMTLSYNPLGAYSDMWPFMQQGCEATFAGGSGSWEYHTYLDDLDHINYESIGYSARVMGSAALYTADQ